MAENKTDRRSGTERAQAYAEMLAAALSRPGVREAMQVFQDWQKKDQSLDTYRVATKPPEQLTSTNSANVV